jgi:hypothetical protein
MVVVELLTMANEFSAEALSILESLRKSQRIQNIIKTMAKRVANHRLQSSWGKAAKQRWLKWSIGAEDARLAITLWKSAHSNK